LNEDFRDLLAALLAAEARFLVVGAHALAVHGAPRATGDLDVWIESTPANAARVWEALQRFGAPAAALGVTVSDLHTPGQVVQIGVPPRRIDLITQISGAEFAPAWQSRVVRTVDDLEVPFLDRETLLRNKRASGRLQDLADAAALERQRQE
jgi:hypothetical protein